MNVEKFRLYTSQLCGICKQLPESTKFFVKSTAQGHDAKFVGERAVILEMLTHEAQGEYPVLNCGYLGGGDSYILSIFAVAIYPLENVVRDFESTGLYCVVFDTNYGEAEKPLPEIKFQDFPEPDDDDLPQ